MSFPCTWKCLESTRVWLNNKDSILIKSADEVKGDLSLGKAFGPADVARQKPNWIEVSFQFSFQSGRFRHKHLIPAEVLWLPRIDALDQLPDVCFDTAFSVETLIDSRKCTEVWIRKDHCVKVFTKYMDCKFWVWGSSGKLLARARYYDAVNSEGYETVNYFLPVSVLVFRPDHIYVIEDGQVEDVDLFATERISAVRLV